MTVYIVSFLATFFMMVGMLSYLNRTNITIQYCFMGIGMGIFASALIGMSFEISKNDLKQQTIQKDSCNDNH
jgi:hypothetical protein